MSKTEPQCEGVDTHWKQIHFKIKPIHYNGIPAIFDKIITPYKLGVVVHINSNYITLRFLDYNVMKTLIIFTSEKITRYTLIHSIAASAVTGNHGIEYEDLDSWLIKIMFVCVRFWVSWSNNLLCILCLHRTLIQPEFQVSLSSLIFLVNKLDLNIKTRMSNPTHSPLCLRSFCLSFAVSKIVEQPAIV